MKKVLLGIFSIAMLVSCGNSGENASAEKVDHSKHNHTTTKKKMSADLVTEKKDPVCGMPITAGIVDTAHYKGKVYGFCADECKALFKEKPEDYLKAE